MYAQREHANFMQNEPRQEFKPITFLLQGNNSTTNCPSMQFVTISEQFQYFGTIQGIYFTLQCF